MGSTAHLVCHLATSALNPIHGASADYVLARMDTFAVTTCVVRRRSFRYKFSRRGDGKKPGVTCCVVLTHSAFIGHFT